MCSTLDGTRVTLDPGGDEYFHIGNLDDSEAAAAAASENCSELRGDLLLGASEDDNQLHRYSSTYNTPEWEDIPENQRWIFQLHSYGFACLFFFLAFYCFFSILHLRSQLSTRPYMSTINSFLCLLGASRAAGLFIDPYGLMESMPVLLGALLWDLGFPSLISSFSLIQIAFLQLTQLDVEPEKFRKKTCLSIIVTVHFVTVIATAIYSNIRNDLLPKLISQLIFALWGLSLCGSFLYAGKQVLGVINGSGGGANSKNVAESGGKKGGLGAMGMGLLAPGGNIAASLTAALAPTLLQSSTPKIKITDENEKTVSVASDSSRLNDNDSNSGRPSTPVPGTSKGTSSSSSDYVRPPSPVLPRRKSGGSSGQLRNASSVTGGTATTATITTTSGVKKITLNSRPGSGNSSGDSDKDNKNKKSLSWSETEVASVGGKKSVHIKDNNSSDGKRRQSRKSMDASEGGSSTLVGGGVSSDRADSTTLLSAGGGPDYTLQSILSHIAYVNQTALDYRLSRKLSRKNQVHKIIKLTSITAILGVLLCIVEIVRVLSPYGLLAAVTEPPGLWPWFALQTVGRIIEFAMGVTVANIAKQPDNRPQHYAYSFRHKGHRESLYL